jgi:hypothetical protein
MAQLALDGKTTHDILPFAVDRPSLRGAITWRADRTSRRPDGRGAGLPSPPDARRRA